MELIRRSSGVFHGGLAYVGLGNVDDEGDVVQSFLDRCAAFGAINNAILEVTEFADEGTFPFHSRLARIGSSFGVDFLDGYL